jgi:hypothetical protein
MELLVMESIDVKTGFVGLLLIISLLKFTIVAVYHLWDALIQAHINALMGPVLHLLKYVLVSVNAHHLHVRLFIKLIFT